MPTDGKFVSAPGPAVMGVTSKATINASFAISTMGLRVVGAGEQCSVRGDRIRGELVHGWAKQGRLCGSASLTPDGPVLAAQDSKLRRSYSPDTRASPKEEAMQSAHAASIDTLDTQTPEERLRALGIELPPAPPAVGDYTPTVIAGNLLFMSGQLPWIAGDLKFKGKMGAELNIEQGYQAFRLSALNAISQLKAALGNLDRVKQIVRLEGTMGCAPGFHDQPKVLDGASHIVNQVFGPRGRHTRMLYSNNEMPLDCATLVVLTAEIMPR